MVIYIFCAFILLNIGLIINQIFNYYQNKKERCYSMSFQAGIDLADLPIVTFYQGNKKYNFLLDTGTMGNIIDVNCDLIHTPLEGSDSLITGTSGDSIAATYSNLSLYYKGKEFKTTTQVTDMSRPFNMLKKDTGVTLHGLLGTTFFKEYSYILDYYNMIAYPKKINKNDN